MAARSSSKRKARPEPAAKPRTRANPKAGRKQTKRKPVVAAKVDRKATAKANGQSKAIQKAVEASGPNVIRLPERLDSSTAASVLADFKAGRGNAMVVDGSNVRRVGAQPLQILISAARTWQSDGCGFSLSNPSSELIEAATLLGLSASELSISG